MTVEELIDRLLGMNPRYAVKVNGVRAREENRDITHVMENGMGGVDLLAPPKRRDDDDSAD